MVRCLGGQGFHVGDNDYNDGGDDGDDGNDGDDGDDGGDGDDAVDQPLFLWEGLSGGGRGRAGGQGGAPRHIWIIIHDIIDNIIYNIYDNDI